MNSQNSSYMMNSNSRHERAKLIQNSKRGNSKGNSRTRQKSISRNIFDEKRNGKQMVIEGSKMDMKSPRSPDHDFIKQQLKQIMKEKWEAK